MLACFLFVHSAHAFVPTHGPAASFGKSHLLRSSVTMVLNEPQGAQIYPEKEAPEEPKRVPLNSLKIGDPLIGAVVDVTNFGAFVDCMVCRPATKGTTVRVKALLHKDDIAKNHILARQPGTEKEDKTVICRGDHVQVYVKSVFKQSGRFSVTMDPQVSKETVAAARSRSKKTQMLRKRAKKLRKVQVGDEVVGEIKKVVEFGAFVDIGAQKSSLLSNECIMHLVGEKVDDARNFIKVGDKVRVSVLSMEGKNENMIKLQLIEVQPQPDADAVADVEAAKISGQEESDFKVFVGGLPCHIREKGLAYYFEKYGRIEKLDLPLHKDSKQPRGFAFIRFKDKAAVDAALEIERHLVGGKMVEVARVRAVEKSGAKNSNGENKKNSQNKKQGGKAGSNNVPREKRPAYSVISSPEEVAL